MEIGLWKIFLSLGIPGLALGVFYMLFRSFKWKFPNLPRTWVAPILILFMILSSSLVLFTLYFWSPKPSRLVANEEQVRGMVRKVMAEYQLNVKQDPKEEETNRLIIETLSGILRKMLSGYDQMNAEEKEKKNREVEDVYREFKNKWGLTDWLYEQFIKTCIEQRRILPLDEFVSYLREIQKQNPQHTDEIVIYLREILLGRKP